MSEQPVIICALFLFDKSWYNLESKEEENEN
jgi:hypothetical protein